jgi:hypothetical protein
MENPYPRLHALAARGPVQKGDLRIEFGLPPFPFWADLQSYMVFGTEAVSKVYFDWQRFSNIIMKP